MRNRFESKLLGVSSGQPSALVSVSSMSARPNGLVVRVLMIANEMNDRPVGPLIYFGGIPTRADGPGYGNFWPIGPSEFSVIADTGVCCVSK